MSAQFLQLLAAWRDRLVKAGHSGQVVWRFREHLTIRPRRTGEGGLVLSYQLGLEEVTEEDVLVALTHLLRTKQAVALQLLAATPEHSVCTLAYDPWDTDESDWGGTDRVYYTVNEPYTKSEAVSSRWRWMQHRLSQYRLPTALDYVERLRRARRWVARHR